MGKRLEYVVVFGDGHAVEKWSERRRGQTVEWAEVYQRWGPTVRLPAGPHGREATQGKGCLWILAGLGASPGLAKLARKAKHIRVTPPSLDNASPKLRSAGVELGLVELELTTGTVTWQVIPDCPDALEYGDRTVCYHDMGYERGLSVPWIASRLTIDVVHEDPEAAGKLER